jgi:hypothetical protein
VNVSNEWGDPLLAAGDSVAVTDSATARIQLTAGLRYRLTVSAPLHVRQGGAAAEATVNDLLVDPDGPGIEIVPTGDADYCCSIAPSGGSGSLFAARCAGGTLSAV